MIDTNRLKVGVTVRLDTGEICTVLSERISNGNYIPLATPGFKFVVDQNSCENWDISEDFLGLAFARVSVDRIIQMIRCERHIKQ